MAKKENKMNAKEFAHELEKAASFIRQQQAEIEALKQIIDANNLNQNIGQFVKVANEPVAWMVESDEDVSFIMCGKGFAKPDESWNKVTPVYTHPVKELALTDEEMISIYEKDWKDWSGIKCGLGRAVEQAILRKAQEK